MKVKQNKLYVDIHTGGIFHKPVEMNDAPFAIKKKFYEITEAQAARIEDGESLGAVIRDGVEAKITAEVEAVVRKENPLTMNDFEVSAPAKEIEVETDAPKTDATGLKEMLPALTTVKELRAAAEDHGFEIPEKHATFKGIKKFLEIATLGK